YLEIPAKGLHNLNSCVTQRDNSSSFYDVRPAAAAHCFESKPKGRCFVFRQFNDKHGFSVFVTCASVYQQCAQENKYDTGQIHGRAHPACIVKKGTCKQRDDRDLRTTRHKRSQHCSRSAFTIITDGTACHNTRNCTADSDNK